MKIRITLLLFILTFAIQLIYADKNHEQEDKTIRNHHIFNFSLFYPFSTNKNENDSTNINISLIYGKIGFVQGFDLSLFASVIKDNLSGLQVTGITGIVGDSVRGGQVSGLLNISGDDLQGIQLSGLGNVTGDSLTGIQGAGIFNVSGEKGAGLQAAGIFNVTGEEFTGLQAAGIFNVTGDDFCGIQASGVLNVVGNTMKGLQASVFNVASNSKGVQIGVLNVAGESSGVQLGVVNYVKNMSGIPIGLVNLSKHSPIRKVAWGSSLSAVNLGIKFIFNKIYTILSLGTINLNKSSSSLVYGFHYGINIPTGRLNINTDIGYLNMDNKDFFKSVSGTLDQHVIKLRGIIEFPTSRSFSIFIGSGLAYIIDHTKSFDSGKFKPLFLAGFELF